MKRYTTDEKRTKIQAVQFSLKNNSLTESCKMQGMSTQQYKLWCAELEIVQKPFDEITKLTPVSKPDDPSELVGRLLAITDCCLVVFANGPAVSTYSKGTERQIKHIQAIGDLQLDAWRCEKSS